MAQRRDFPAQPSILLLNRFAGYGGPASRRRSLLSRPRAQLVRANVQLPPDLR